MNALLKSPLYQPSQMDIELATAASRTLASMDADDDVHLTLHSPKMDKLDVIIPQAAMSMLISVLTHMSQGNTVTLFPYHAELTTQEAADFLNVSRPYLVKLLEAGDIEFTKVGRHRRVKFSDLLEYKSRKAEEQEAAMAKMVASSEEIGGGY